MTYKETLRDPRWQKKRLLILQRDNWGCVKCGSTTRNLQVHHIRYRKGFDPWEYFDSDLETLCEFCHKKEHNIEQEIEYERKYEHLIITKKEPDVIIGINKQIEALENRIQTEKDFEIVEEALKNIMFLQNKKKEILDCK